MFVRVMNPNYLCHDWKTNFLMVAVSHVPPINRRVGSEYMPWLTDIMKQMRH